MTFPKIVEGPHYHLWTDALHARALAKQANNRWDRGTYVRWTVTTAWTVLEMACEDALETTGIGRRFRENLDDACAAKATSPLDWGSGVWQRVSTLHETRKEFVHINAAQERLFPESQDADCAISVVRDAITDIFVRLAKLAPDWLQDDEDKGWDRSRGSMANGQSLHGDVDPHGEDTVRISYEYKGREYDSSFWPAGTDHKPLIGDLLTSLRIPVTAVRAYHGNAMVYERKLQMRGA